MAAELPNRPPRSPVVAVSYRFHTGFIPGFILEPSVPSPTSDLPAPDPSTLHENPASRLQLNLGPLASANGRDLGCLLCFPGVWLARSQCVVSYPVSYRRLGRPVGYVVHFRIALTGRAPRIRCAGPRGWNLCLELGPRGLQRAVSYPVSYRFHTLGFIPRFHTGFIPVSYLLEVPMLHISFLALVSTQSLRNAGPVSYQFHTSDLHTPVSYRFHTQGHEKV